MLKFIRNEAEICNLTTFHCIYLVNDLFSKIDIDLLFAYLLTDTAKRIFSDNRREYGNGLKKFEPNDLNNAQSIPTDLQNCLSSRGEGTDSSLYDSAYGQATNIYGSQPSNVSSQTYLGSFSEPGRVSLGHTFVYDDTTFSNFSASTPTQVSTQSAQETAETQNVNLTLVYLCLSIQFFAPVAQLDRALGYGPRGCGFNSCRAHA